MNDNFHIHLRLQGVVLAALVFLVAMAGCAPTLPVLLPPASAYGEKVTTKPHQTEEALWKEVHNRISEDRRVLDADQPVRDAALCAAARELASGWLKSDEKHPLDIFLNTALVRRGIVARPASVRHLAGQGNLDPKSIDWLEAALREASGAGYSHVGLGYGFSEDQQWVLVLIALRRDIRLEEPIPRQVTSGDMVTLAGFIGDDVGRLRLTIQSPKGLVHFEHIPFLAGHFRQSFRLNQSGVFNMELSYQEIEGGWRSVMVFTIAVDSPAEDPKPAKLELNRDTLPSRLMLELIRQRRLRGLPPLKNNAAIGPAIAKWVVTESEMLTPSVTHVIREINIEGQPQLDCTLLSSYGQHLGTLAADNFSHPAYQKVLYDYKAIHYQAWTTPSHGGWRLGEIICSPKEEKPAVLRELVRSSDRKAYRDMLSQKISVHLGLEFVDTDNLAVQRWILTEGIGELDSVESISALMVHGLARTSDMEPTKNENINRRIFVDDLFATIWASAAELRQNMSTKDPGFDSLSLLILHALLIQNRPEAFDRELETLQNRGGNSPLAAARIAQASAWRSAIQGDAQAAIEHMLASVATYEKLGYDQLIRKLAVQTVLLYRFIDPPDSASGR